MDERMEFFYLGREKKCCVRLDSYKMIILRVETLHKYIPGRIQNAQLFNGR